MMQARFHTAIGIILILALSFFILAQVKPPQNTTLIGQTQLHSTEHKTYLKHPILYATPFVSSTHDLDSINCAFYLAVNSTRGYESCLTQLAFLKNKSQFSNSTQIKKFKTCAVVGSGSNLLQAKHGAAIDNTEKIFRMNEAPTEGYQEDVGSRTDYRLMHYGMIETVSAKFANESFQRVFSLHEGKLESFSTIAQYYDESVDNIIHPMLLRNLSQMISPHNDSQYYQSMLGKFTGHSVATGYCSPSSGIRALLLALMLCDDVTAYGYSMDFNQNKDTWSYFRGTGLSCIGCWSDSTATTTNHCFLQERDLMKKWTEESAVLFNASFRIIP